MSRPTIKTTLTGLFAFLAITIMAISAYSISTKNDLNKNTAQIGRVWMPKVVNAREIKGNFNLLRMAYYRQLVSSTPEDVKAQNELFLAAKNDLDRALEDYRKDIATPQGQEIFNRITAEVGSYQKLGETLVALRDEKRVEEAKVLMFTTMRDQAQKANVAVDELVSSIMDNANGFVVESENSSARSLIVTAIVSVIAILCAIGAGIYARWGVAVPIESITGSMKSLAEGKTDRTIPFIGRSDEIGAMANAVEIFRAAAIAKAEMEQQAVVSHSQGEAERQRVAQEERVRAQQMAEATSGLAAGLKRLSGGDLTVRIEERFASDFETLRADFNATVGQLGQTMTAVAQAAGSIDSGTREISGSADDLAKRTEQQAASLEETAAALDQITVNVSNASKRTEEARSVAIKANTSASQSGGVVASAVDAMQRIEQSSSQISNIIGVIDEIAFQTNLLALNAGVEAARAGDAGKGFAVVAQEVRELAQRSAKAAKEIKELIRNSTTEVESGVKLVRETGEALKTIEAYVVTINQHMDAIATSSREQSTGLAEVNTAVNQMDQVTQQNAAMVEETNAASATLANESSRLRDLIAQFQLGSGASASSGASSSALRQMASSMAAPASRQPSRVSAPSTAVRGNVALKTEEWAEF